MSSIVLGCMVPHPPIMVPEVGGPEVQHIAATQRAMEEVAAELARAAPEVLVIISPHGPVQRSAMGIGIGPSFDGDLAYFGAPSVRLSFQGDKALAEAIQEEAKAREVRATTIGRWPSHYGLDHGVIVPMYYLRPAVPQARLVPLTFSALPYGTHFVFGQAIRAAADRCGQRVALIASGDLSHRLLPHAPAGYDPQGQVFDHKVASAIRQMDADALMQLGPELVERAGECGLRSLIILMGALKEAGFQSRVLSYEGPFGVGYLVASFSPPGEKPQEERQQGGL